ncbi:MAG: GldG family protein [Bdellovibrionaceae bacterium]|nr:GldG family protein [Pseudobdellovibrionaceae bacterium]
MSRLSKISFFLSGLSLVCFVIARFLLGGWIPAFYIVLGAFAVFLVIPFVKDFAFFRDFFTTKTTKHGMNMGAMILLVVVGLVLINILAVRKYKVWDFSEAKQNSLSEQSVQIAKSLKEDLRVRFFYKKGAEGNDQNRRAFRELLQRYQDVNDKISLDFIEVDERPDLASEYGVTKGSGVVFIDYRGRRNRVENIEEQAITNAMIKVTRERDYKVYFTEGHGELDLSDAKDPAGGNALKMMLENNSYVVTTHPLITNQKIPEDADVLVIAGPRQTFSDGEITGLKEYLKRGGRLVLALEPGANTGLEALLKDAGLSLGNNYVLNLVNTYFGKGINQGPTVATNFSTVHEITKPFGRSQAVTFLYPQAILRDKIPDGLTAEDLVKTDAESAAFPSLRITGEGKQGPHTLAMLVEGQWPGSTENKKKARVLVIGDADFISNRMLFRNLNRDLFLNTLASLTDSHELVSIAPREVSATQLVLTPTKFSLYLWIFIIPFPFLLLGTSAWLWVRRRYA